MQSFASKLTSGQSQMPDLKDIVDQYFDFAEKVLAKQREFAQQWTSATTKASQAVTEQAQRATSRWPRAPRTAPKPSSTEGENAAETARAAGDAATT